MSVAAYWRLMRAGFVLAREGALAVTEGQPLPPGVKRLVAVGRTIERRSVRATQRVEKLARALERLGPTYVKLGQLLATRPDIVGAGIADDLSALHDRMPAFDERLVPGLLRQALGERRAAQLTEISESVAAASIAQVHRATLDDGAGPPRVVAIKMLRPGIEARFQRDLDAVMTYAKLAERFSPPSRRLRPVAVAQTLERSALIEMDLRLEAAAMSEMADNIAGARGFEVPKIEWAHTARNVLTTNWIEAITIRDHGALDAAGLNRKTIARELMQHFLRHAIQHGFFHADMHPGNLFVDPATGAIKAVDFGIMGRIGKPERRFLAEILHGFIVRDYRRMAVLHIEIGYVPSTHSVDDFAQALRSIGEPMHGRPVSEISMANMLAQLMAVTELFDMRTRPELVLLQKTMVVVEGVARSLDPSLDLWATAEPVVGDWVRRQAGPLGQAEKLLEIGTEFAGAARRVPGLIARYEALLDRAEETEKQRHRHFGPMLAVAAWIALVLVGIAAIATIF
ncbi:MAG TPA: 2-polyprenylphenol 6-hydroxylase [Devosiaceae bacterium]|nr:2-polyprenylphenol 6-hydroxylase [Devosiaceae bacterium]